VQEAVSRLPGTRVIAIYGPTEGTTYSTCNPFAHGSTVPASVPIGKPIANARCYVLGEDQKPVPVGTLGELYIAGDGLARGYLNNPELTAERFVTLEVADGVTERLYRTGDQVRYLEDGSLEFHGRIDSQVKLRGYRIELGEIEAALLAIPAVRQSCVVPVREDGRVSRLVAFCVPEKKGACEDAFLRQSLGSKLPAYMLPASFIEVDAFPLNINGKIDRAKLLEIATARRGERQLVAAATPEEATLAAIVAEVMQLNQVGVTENLFEIGVDSLRVFQIASRAAKAGLSITPRTIMKARTIRAALVEAQSSTAAAPQAMEIKPIARQRIKLSAIAGRPGEQRAPVNDTRH
jgi:long-subunit acyl-CoA synthetase (AMP-forming)